MTINNAITIQKYATLSAAAYSGQAVPLGWTVLRTSELSTTGFSATAFRNAATGEVVVAFRLGSLASAD